MDLTQILTNIGVFAIGSGIFAWLVQAIIKFWLDKELDVHKIALNKDLEAYKNQLQQLSKEHEIKFSRLHEERATIISEFYKKIIELENNLRNFIYSRQSNEVKSRQDLFIKSYNNFVNFYELNKLYFNKNVVSLIDEIQKQSISVFLDSYQDDKKHENSQKISTIIPALKQELEQEFRELLGVK